jgi:hypothetical protein
VVEAAEEVVEAEEGEGAGDDDGRSLTGYSIISLVLHYYYLDVLCSIVFD